MVSLPTFRAPRRQRQAPAEPPEQPEAPEPELATEPSPGPRDGDSPGEPASPTSPTTDGEARTRSTTGSRRRTVIDEVAVAATLAGGLALLAGGAAWLLSKRGLYLRPPTDAETNDVATPLARIVGRHSDAAWLTADLADGLDAAVAMVTYGQSRPISKGLPTRQATPMPEGTEPL